MVKKENKKLSKFDEARLFATRALEIAEGDKAKVELDDKKTNLKTQDYVKIAKKEYEEGKIELEIHRSN